MDSRRIKYIDITKGIGILLVALAHADISLFSPYLHRFIYAFHMPLFFFLSGYFFKPEISFRTLLKRRFNSILKPYFITIAIIYIASLSFTSMRFVNAFGRILRSLYATGHYLDWVQLWFLPSLFVTSLFAFLLYRTVLIRVRNRYVRWLILLGVQAIAVATLGLFYPFPISLSGKEYELYGLPFSLDLVLLSGFFYILGNEIRHVTSEKTFSNIWILLVTGSGLIVTTLYFQQRSDFNTRVFESFPINTVEAILGILFALAVSKQIEMRTTWLASALKYIGQASLFILIFHVPIQEYWAPKLLFVTDQLVFSILAAFVISILICLGIYRLFFEQNPIALYWFGRISSRLQKNEPTTRSTQSEEQEFPE